MYGKEIKVPPDSTDRRLKWWFRQLERSRKTREKEEPLWASIEAAVDGRPEWIKNLGDRDRATINLIRSHVQARQAATLFRNPRAVCRPVKKEDYRPASGMTLDPQTGAPQISDTASYRVQENLINFVVSQPDFRFNQTLRLFNQAGMSAIGVVMVGYTADFEEPMSVEGLEGIPVDPATGMPDFSKIALDENGEPLQDEDGNLIPAVRPTSEQWFVEWVPYRRMLFDPDGDNNFSGHRWVACEYVRPLADVKKDKRLKHTRDLKANAWEDTDLEGTMRLNDTRDSDPVEHDRAARVRLFYIWDIQEREFIVLADGHDKFLRHETTPKGQGRHPFVFLRLGERIAGEQGESGGQWYYRPPLADLVPVNQTFDVLVTQYIAAARRAARKHLMREGTLNDRQKDIFTSPDDDVVVEIGRDQLGPNDTVEGVIVPYAPPPVSMDLMQGIMLMQKVFDQVAGQPAEARGVATAETATQANIMENRGQMREDDHRRILADAVAEIFKKLNDSIQANMTLPIAVAIEGNDGRMFQKVVNYADIEGDFDVTIDMQEMIPRNDDTERAHFIEFLQTFVQQPAIGMDEALTGAMLDMFHIRNSAVRDGLVRISKMMAASAMGPPPGQIGPGEGAAPPQDQAQMLSQMGGAMAPMMGA